MRDFVRHFRLRCQVRGELALVRVHVGRPAPGHHPLELQLAWLREVLGGEVLAQDLEWLAARLAEGEGEA